MANASRYVPVLETPDPVELSMARNLLEQAGIPCALQNDSASSLVSAVAGPMAGTSHTLLVPGELLERALAVLEEAWGSLEDEDGPQS